MKISKVLENLSRFPQCAHLELCGDWGIQDLRVFSPVDPNNLEGNWAYFRIDEPYLPWMKVEEE